MATPIEMPNGVQQYTVDRSPPFTYQIENLMPDTRYNVSVQANTDSGYHPGASDVFSTDDARENLFSIFAIK